jgi:uncharacterized protein (TIGR03437 family)
MTQTTNLPSLVPLVCVLVVATAANAQQPPTLLYVDVENWVGYAQDVTDQSKVATSAGPLSAAPPVNFSQWLMLADISAVNDTPAKGVLVLRTQNVRLSPTPTPGMSIGDVVRQAHAEFSWEFLQPDGTPIGSIYCEALSGGIPAPGSPLAATQGSGVIVGGTGAFLGARGTINAIKSSTRSASQGEDPSMRRSNGGGAGRFVLQIMPMFRPEIIATSSGPAVMHSGDFSPVTTAKPAKAGEILTLFATGLGPTRPGVDPGQPFPAPQVVNSPVEVLVNGTAVQALYAGGYPGAIDGYQVNFRLPDSTAPGVGAIALKVAWISGAEIKIRVQ